MFTKHTLFILGAGVSVPFGFPSGEMLLRILTGAISNENCQADIFITQQHGNLINVLKTVAIDSTFVDEFVAKLKASGTPSIDTWLSQTENKKFMDFGKIAIAAVIANAEHHATNHPYVADDWYKWLITKMMSNTINLDQFLENKVTFITFNYDRMLEWRLGQCIDNFYGVAHGVRNSALKGMFGRIVHVHGHLAFDNYDSLNQNIRNIALNSVSSFQGGERIKRIIDYGIKAQELSKSIKIIGEGVDNNHEYQYVSLIQGAEKIIFLGFGYDDKNIALLRIKGRALQLLNKSFNDPLEIPIVGSAYGLGNAQRKDAKSEIHNGIYLGEKDLSCVPFCNEYVSTKVTN
jgi:hypothetical protein